VALAWHDSNVIGPLFGHDLSSGTLRFLHLATMLLSSELPPVLALDEPEVSFHPELLRLLAELIMDASERTQIIAATHSAPLLRWLKPEHIAVVDRDIEGSTLTRGDQLDLNRWLENCSLDELWQVNVIGAQP
jgi:predicted ATPase